MFPSTTGVAYIPFLFGRYPGSVGIPVIRWLDPAESLRFRRAALGAAAHYIGTYAALERAIAKSWLDCAGESFQTARAVQTAWAGDLVLAAAPGADFRGPGKSPSTGPATGVSLRNIWKSQSPPAWLFRKLPSVQ